MSLPDVPDEVWQFIAQNIDTVPQLEALLLLWENQHKAWSEDEIAARIYVSRDAAAGIVQALQRHQLITAEAGSPPRYQYSSAGDASNLMPAVAAAYRRHLVPVANFIHSGASSSVREFARAFNLKKDR